MTEQIETAPAEPTVTPETPVNEAPKEAPSIDDALANAFRADISEKTAPEADAPEAPQEPEVKTGPERGPDGKFVAKGDEKTEPVVLKEPKEALKEDQQPTEEAPARFSAEAKAAWKDASPAIRHEVQRAFRELESGLSQKDEQLRPIKPFIEMAEQGGTTLEAALNNYVSMENTLRQDPAKGLNLIAQNMGMTLPDLIGKVTGQRPDQAQNAKDQEILGLKQTITQLQQQMQGFTQDFQSQREMSAQKQIEEFAQANPRFDELADDIAHMLQTGFASDLQDAYEKADRLKPAPAPEPAAPQPDTAQPRQSKSVTGAPSAGSDPAKRPPSKSPEEALKRAFQM